ncbi:MAG: collagen-like protein, partial [Flavobacteriales bacterium]|nr:collagen-like protein [Flavobacteriales bacterium]
MKQALPYLFLLISVLTTSNLMAQDNMGIGTSTPDPSAILELDATDKGFLVPRLTTVQRNAVVSPATGLMVYDTDVDQFWYFDGIQWVQAIGPAGADGNDGAPGADGATGADGNDGAPGADGATGADGNDGAPGADGATGADGNDGAPGADGA